MQNFEFPSLFFWRSKKFRDFVTVCLIKDYLKRPTAEQLLQVRVYVSIYHMDAIMNCDSNEQIIRAFDVFRRFSRKFFGAFKIYI